MFVGEGHATRNLHSFWSQVTPLGRLTLPAGITDEETAADAGIYLCRGPA